MENIEDVNTDALMLNTALQINYWQVKLDGRDFLVSRSFSSKRIRKLHNPFSQVSEGQMSLMASLTEISCHTCRFNPDERHDTMFQILKPCTLAVAVTDQVCPLLLQVLMTFSPATG